MEQAVPLSPLSGLQGLEPVPLHQRYGLADVVAERRRQIQKEGWSPEHDDAYERGEMAGAAACYALTNVGHWAAGPAIDQFWPWDEAWWKPSGNRRNLVKAAALLLAEIERIDRAALGDAS